LAGKTAVVTGGSKGIGLETARGLAREGVRVMICARRRSALAEAAEDIRKTTGSKVVTHPLDVTDLGAIGELPKVIQQKLGAVDLLVNNAGTGTYKPFFE
jgi:3-oxoacyl-[acyl-carrier protein] reductase